ncbi:MULTISPECIES: helix-turn-helix domain-containing protein [unclassified Streptomyces]|uniref:helix-turn-helix domain-containing protein n=1 Tax=unclassified Streptomyces TaxID=2593676 RepID=UPI0033B2366C
MTPEEHVPDPRGARSPAEFLARLQALKDWSGLTYRELSAQAEARGDVLPRSTVANMLSRTTLPREELLTAFVRACGTGPAALERWRTVRRELAGRRGDVEGPDPDPEGRAPETPNPAEENPEKTALETPAPAERHPERTAPEETGPAHEEPPAPEDTSENTPGDTPGNTPDSPPVWPGAPADEPPGPGPGNRCRIRGIHGLLVPLVAVAALVFAGVSVVAFLRDGHAGHPPRTPTAPAAGDVLVRVVGTDFCLGERRGTRTGRIHQVPCAAADVPLYALVERGDGRWRIASDHPDHGAGCSGLPSGGRVPDAPYEDSECGDPTRIEEFSLEPYGTPVRGYRIVPAGSATPGACVTVVGDRAAPWSRLAQAPCAPDATGQLFDFDRRD